MGMEDIFSKARQKDAAAFEELIKPLQKPVYVYLLCMGIGADKCKEICANVFIEVFLNIGECDGADNFAAWVFGVAEDECMGFFRDNKMKTRVLTRDDIDFSPDSEGARIEKERAAQLLNAVNALAPHLRVLIVLRDIEGFSYENIAKIARLKVSAVKSLISRARAALAENITTGDLL